MQTVVDSALRMQLLPDSLAPNLAAVPRILGLLDGTAYRFALLILSRCGLPFCPIPDKRLIPCVAN
jgi:hypothetical protein